MLKGIGQIAINVHDLERATAFYRDVLGIRFLFSAPPQLAFFEIGGITLMLSPPDENPVGWITNGVHTPTFVAPEMRLLFDRYMEFAASPRDFGAEGLRKGLDAIPDHLFWSARSIGDRLRLEFAAGETGPGTVAVGLTRTCDHAVFKVSINKVVVAEALDLWNPDLVTQETEFKKVPLRAGSNELEFEVVGSNPSAREWADGNGVFKLGVDYVLVR